jgi:adenylate cyclase
VIEDDQKQRLSPPASSEQAAEFEKTGESGQSGAGDALARLRGAAIALDTQPGLLASARRLRRRLPGDDRFGDPLSTSGDGPAQRVARGVSALRPERESLLREIGFTGLQLWQSVSEATGRGRGDQALAILFTDLVGFSSWALQAGDGPALELLREVDHACKVAIEAHRGQIVKRLGDGLMATLPTAQAAVEAALEAQEALGGIEVAGYRPRMRAGVHWGRPRPIGDDFLGVDVNIAARVADAAKPGDVLVSEAAAKLVVFDGLKVGRSKRLKAAGAPRDTFVQRISRA